LPPHGYSCCHNGEHATNRQERSCCSPYRSGHTCEALSARRRVGAMGLFRVRGRLPWSTGRSEDAVLLVDTGATLLVVPRALAERLELVARRSQQVLVAGGSAARVARGRSETVPQWPGRHHALLHRARDGPGQRAIAVRTLAFAPVKRVMPGVRLGIRRGGRMSPTRVARRGSRGSSVCPSFGPRPRSAGRSPDPAGRRRPLEERRPG